MDLASAPDIMISCLLIFYYNMPPIDAFCSSTSLSKCVVMRGTVKGTQNLINSIGLFM